ncbi:MAG: GNAT family N-acetyltransferase [Gemmatimonadota bacterium]
MSAYVCIRHESPAAFLARAEPWLIRNEVEHNLILGVAAQLKQADNHSAYFATLEHDGQVTGCAFRTPPYKLGVTRMPLAAAAALAADVVQAFDEVPGVLGPEAVASIVAHDIAKRQQRRAQPGRQSRIYELRKVVPSEPPPPGRLRLAQPADQPVLASWLESFARETDHAPTDMRGYTQAHIANKTVFVWDDDGPKTTALWAGIMPHGVRIGFVFTPAEFRGRGYASAVTAGASQRALDRGYDFCCLYTDLGNPTSNAIYQKIGYTPVCDVVDYAITWLP